MKNYYLFLNGVAEGPFTADDIRSRLTRREIQAGTLVGEEGGADWIAAGEIFPEALPVASPPPLVAAAPPPRTSPPPLPSTSNPYQAPRPGYDAAPANLSELNYTLTMDGAFIPGTQGLTAGQVVELVKQGGRFVVWRYNFSIVVLSFRRSSGVQFIRPGESGFLGCLGYSTLSALVGWWGFPWGVIWTPMTLFRNMAGGQDLTEPVLSSIVGPAMADRIVKSRPSTFHWHTVLAGALPLLFPAMVFMSLILGVASHSSSPRRSLPRPSGSSSSTRSVREGGNSTSRESGETIKSQRLGDREPLPAGG